MNYELALKLKDAGCPQNGVRMIILPNERIGERDDFELKDVTDSCEYPTLSELIEACGNKPFFTLMKMVNKYDAGIGLNLVEGVTASGDSFEEAVANLWLELNPPPNRALAQ